MKNVLAIVLQCLEKECGLLRDYTVFDLETTGLQLAEDLIYEIGVCEVRDGVGQWYESSILNWYQCPDVEAAWLTWKIGVQNVKFAELNKPCHLSRARILQGEAPEKVLQRHVDLFEQAARERIPIVGYNNLRFDDGRFEFAVKEWLGVPFTFDANVLVDVGAIQKAVVLGITPDADEPMLHFQQRVLRAFAGGAKWGLSPYCVEHYKLAELYDLDMSQAHTAGWDSLVTHLVLEEMRETAKV